MVEQTVLPIIEEDRLTTITIQRTSDAIDRVISMLENVRLESIRISDGQKTEDQKPQHCQQR